MTDLLTIGILPVVLILVAFRAGQLLQQKTGSAVLNPIVVAAVLILGFLAITGMEVSAFQAGAASLSWLMTPATVCLAIPMYEQFRVLRRNLPAIAAGVAAGALSCLVFLVLGGLALGLDRALLISLLPKSVTTAIGVPLSQLSGGMASITTAAIILTGISANVLGGTFCRLFRLTDPIAQGVGFGTAGHVIGTSKANELGTLTGAVSSLSLVVAGLLTAVVMSVLVRFL